MILAEPQWLQTLGQMAGTLLLLELCVVLLLVCVIVTALGYVSWWLHTNVIPVLDEYGGRAQRYMGVAIQGSDRVIGGVAEFHGRWEAITTGARIMIFGTRNSGRRTLSPGHPLTPAISDATAAPDPSQLPGAARQIDLDRHAQ